MQEGRTMDAVGRKLSFAEAEELEMEQYAKSSWKENAAHVLGLVKKVYTLIDGFYPQKMEPVFKKAKLKEME